MVEKSKDVIEDQSHLSLVVRCVTFGKRGENPTSQIGQNQPE
jgi:hypothetical protein